MAGRGGARPGAGRPRKADVPLERLPDDVVKQARAAVRANMPKEGTGHRKAVHVLRDVMHFFLGLAATYQPTDTNTKSDPKKFREYALDAVAVAAKLAPYESATIQPVRLIPDELDLSKLSNVELGELERLHAKASLTGGDTPGASETIN